MSYKESSGGSGTVTTVSVATANGFSGTVANATTTPAITIVAGAITPSSVAATGAVTGLNVPSVVYLSSPVSNNANPAAWADITGLTVAVAANGVYVIRAVLLTVGSATTNWALYGVNGPASPSLVTVAVSRSNVTAGTGNQASVATAYDTGTAISSTNNSGSMPVYMDIFFVNGSTAGTLALRQKNTTNGAAVSTNSGSFMVTTRLA